MDMLSFVVSECVMVISIYGVEDTKVSSFTFE